MAGLGPWHPAGSRPSPPPPPARGPSFPRPRPFPSLRPFLPPHRSPLTPGRNGVPGPRGRAHPLLRCEGAGWASPGWRPAGLAPSIAPFARSPRFFGCSRRLGAQQSALCSSALGKLQTTPRVFPARRGPPSPALAARRPVWSPPASAGGGAARLHPHPTPPHPPHAPQRPRAGNFLSMFWNIIDGLRGKLTQNTGFRPGEGQVGCGDGWNATNPLQEAFLVNFNEKPFLTFLDFCVLGGGWRGR